MKPTGSRPGLKDMYVHDFPAVDYVRSGNISSSYVKIGDMDVQVYRDKRKKFRHKVKPTFQEIMYNYHAPLKIDSIGILQGKCGLYGNGG